MAKAAKKTSDAVSYWLREIAAARKREKSYREDGKRIRAIYAGEKKETQPFNILFSNTETMLPAVYSAIPRPVVQRRYKDDDPIGKAAATAGQRALEFLLDTNIEGYETFNEAMKWATLDGLLPGRGVTTVKYDAEIGEYPADAGTEPAADGDKQEEEGKASGEPVSTPVKKSELVCSEARSWDRVLFGYARKWSRVPWISYEEYLDKDEATRLFGAAIAGKIEYTAGEQDEDDDGKGRKKDQDEENTGERKTALVYQIWDKSGGRKIRYVSPHYKEEYLKVDDDPLELTGFFNCPQPLMFIDKTDDLVPTSMYSLYENQATELNSLTVRINRLIKAIKARGLYDGELGDSIQNLMEADDNELLPTDKGASLAADKGLANAIWFMPLDVLVMTLKEMYVAREACKQVIYEITGISDILRGASNAAETATAQSIKTQWGSLRLKPKQAEVQRYARDLLRMMLEIAATKFSEDTWARMTGLPFLTQMQAAQAQAMAQAAVQQGQPQPMQQLQQQITWAQVLGTLKDDIQRAYKVDIETNSTVEPEAVEDQKNVSDLLQAIGTFIAGVGPMIAEGVMPFQTAQSMLLAITRRFRFGSEIEDQIRSMQPPAPKDDGKAAQTAQQLQEMQGQLQKVQGDAQAKDLQSQGDKAKLEQVISQLQTQIKALQLGKDLDKRSTDLDVRELALNTQKDQHEHEKRSAQESITSKAQGETQKLEHKRQIVGLEARGAKDQQNVSKTVDSKLSDSVKTMTTVMEKVMTTVAEQSAATQELIKAVKAPRVRKAKRDSSGRISEVSEEAA